MFKKKDNKLIKDNNADLHGDILKSLFVSQDENIVLKQFEAEKIDKIEAELGEKIALPDIKRGWNEWAGEGVQDNGFQMKIARAEQFKQNKIKEMKEKRADNRLKGVVLNS